MSEKYLSPKFGGECDINSTRSEVMVYVPVSQRSLFVLQVFLTSPAGTKSTLLQRRTRDTSTEGFSDWAFMTTHNWGESSVGRWTLEVHNGDSACKYKSSTRKLLSSRLV